MVEYTLGIRRLRDHRGVEAAMILTICGYTETSGATFPQRSAG